MSTPKSISAARRSRGLYQAALRNPRGTKAVELSDLEADALARSLLPTPETLFEIFNGIRVRRPFLGLTRDCVRDVCRKTAADLGIEVSDDYPGYLWGDGTDPHEDVAEVLKSE